MKKTLLIGIAAMVLCLTVGAKSSKGKKEDKGPPKPTAIYTIEGCGACDSLIDYLKECGVKISRKSAEKAKYSDSPTVTYTDGARDHGEKIYAGACALPASLKVVEATQPKSQ